MREKTVLVFSIIIASGLGVSTAIFGVMNLISVNSYNTLMEDYVELSGDYDVLQTNYSEVLVSYHNVNEKYQNLTEDYGDLNETYYILTGDNADLQRDYDKLVIYCTKLEVDYNDLVIKYDKLIMDYNELQKDYINLQDDYNELQENNTNLQNQYDTLLNEYQILQIDYDNLNETYYILVSNYLELQDDYDDLVIEYTNLFSDYNDLITQFNTLQQEYDDLQMDYTNLQMQYNDLLDDYQTLNESYNNLLGNYSLLYEAYFNLIDNYNNLLVQYQDLQIQYDTLKTYISTLILPAQHLVFAEAVRRYYMPLYLGGSTKEWYMGCAELCRDMVLHDSDQENSFGVVSNAFSESLRYGSDTMYLAWIIMYYIFWDWLPNWGGYDLSGDEFPDIDAVHLWCIDEIDYEYDTNITFDQENPVWDYFKFPVETAFRTMGDCEDQAILDAAYLESCGFETAIAMIHDPNHPTYGSFYHGTLLVHIEDTDSYNSIFPFHPLWNLGVIDPYGGSTWSWLDPTWDIRFGWSISWLDDYGGSISTDICSIAICDINGSVGEPELQCSILN